MPPQPQQQRRGPPLAGRPPFATDEDDSIYDQPAPRRTPPPKKTVRNTVGRDSMYSAWDNYLQNEQERPQSGAGGIGKGLMELDDSDDSDEPAIRKPSPNSQAPASVHTKPKADIRQPPNQQGSSKAVNNSKPNNNIPNNISASSEKNNTASRNRTPPPAHQPSAPITARPPPPNVPAVPMALQQQQQPPFTRTTPSPRPHIVARTPPPMQHPRPRQAPGVQRPPAALRVDVMPPRAPVPAFMQGPPQPASPGLNPHPLNAPSTPITPIFAKPTTAAPSRKVEFSNEAIMRGNSEETLLPKTTAKGAEFWHRFSVVAKEDTRVKGGKSSWLKRYEGGRNRMSRWVWCISIFILAAIGAAIGLGWYFTHNNKPALPLAVGGSANEAATISNTNIRPAATDIVNPSSRTLIAPPARETKRSSTDDSDSFPMPRRRSNATPNKRTANPHSRWKKSRISSIDALD